MPAPTRMQVVIRFTDVVADYGDDSISVRFLTVIRSSLFHEVTSPQAARGLEPSELDPSVTVGGAILICLQRPTRLGSTGCVRLSATENILLASRNWSVYA